jgi:hypothetical protein
MLNLSRVTLFAIDNTNRIEGTIKSLHTSMQVAKFGATKLVTSKEYIDKYSDELLQDGIVCEEMVPSIANIDDYNYYILYELHRHIETDFVLISQDHAFIINPEAWTDEFLNYDYLGAPWPWRENSFVTPFGEHIRSGNGGFSLRSKRLLEVPNKVNIPFKVAEQADFYKMFGATNTNEDGNICVHNRHIFMEQGCKFPPVELAAKFSYESPVPENQGIIPFGFHNNLPMGVSFE